MREGTREGVYTYFAYTGIINYIYVVMRGRI